MSRSRSRALRPAAPPHAGAGPDGGEVAAPALALDGVTFAYGRQAALSDVTLRVDRGEAVAVVGPNGSGKSTLIKVGLGLLRPGHGRVALFGTPVGRFADWQRIGYVPQRAGPDSAVPVSVAEVVRSGLAQHVGLLRRLSRAQRDTVAHVMDVMGVAGLARRSIATLSGGQQQRALIARALVTEPDLLVLDEPTSGVDAEARHTFRDSLAHLRRHEGVAMVYISHDPDAFAGLVDRAVAMRAGRAHDQGPTPTGHGQPAAGETPHAG